ncbi:hypothetical protein SCUCBS95973_002259 [Sporothrix curviconia]|uniref:EthD domain-containing protein n=1 Tax=Sporothrix curviconia TaxID=1260050 RepID=A0ABP0B5L6_9PEZI
MSDQKQEQPRQRAHTHERIDHQFTYPRFDYDTPVKYQPCIKISLFFRKRPDVSYEHFYKHWATVHADLTAASGEFRSRNILRYTQHHCTPEERARIHELGVEAMDYDACTTMWVRAWDDMVQFHKSEDFKRMAADCAHFLDLSPGGLRAMTGHDVIVVGAGIPGVDDEAGGLPSSETGQGWKC